MIQALKISNMKSGNKELSNLQQKLYQRKWHPKKPRTHSTYYGVKFNLEDFAI